MPPEELRVYQSECCLRLNELRYSDFFVAIKRFGYQSDLNDEHLELIAPDILLDYKQMQKDELSAYRVFYLNPLMLTDLQRYSVKNLLRIGWLCCQHGSETEQLDELWVLINPQLDEIVAKSVVVDFMKLLVSFATQINKSKFDDV